MAAAAVPRWWNFPRGPIKRSSRCASISGTGAGTAVLCAHVHPVLRRKHSDGRIRSTADPGTQSMPASRQAPFIRVHNFRPPDYASVTGIGNWVTAVTLRGKCRARVCRAGVKELSGTVLRNAQAVNAHYGCNPTQLVCHPSVIASLQTLSTAKVARRLRMRAFAASLPRIHTRQRRWHGATTSYLRLNSEGVDDDCVRQIVWTNTARLRAGWLLAMGHHVCQIWRSWCEGHRIQ
jgi:hypothetical protein